MLAHGLNHIEYLMAKREELVCRIGQALIPGIERLPDPFDEAQQSSERTTAIALNEADLYLLREVENALERIKVGLYGICEDCDLPIKPSRLRAVPWALRCVNCQEVHDIAEDHDSIVEAA